MGRLAILLCCGLAGCATVEGGISQVQQAATGLADRIEAAFASPTELYDDMTESDIALAVAAMRMALETKPATESVDWTNSESGNHGSIVPRRTFVTDVGAFCREYDEHLRVGGRDGVVRNTACRSDEGDWIWTS